MRSAQLPDGCLVKKYKASLPSCFPIMNGGKSSPLVKCRQVMGVGTSINPRWAYLTAATQIEASWRFGCDMGKKASNPACLNGIQKHVFGRQRIQAI